MKIKKNVRFHIFNDIQYISREIDKSLWYSKIDYRKFQLDLIREISTQRLLRKTEDFILMNMIKK
jgi:hypothetical protein